MPLWMLYKAGRMQGASAYSMGMLRHYIEDHKQRCPGIKCTDQRTLGNTMRDFAKFMWTPFAPGYNPSREKRRFSFPVTSVPRYAMADERWKRQYRGESRKLLALQRPARLSALVGK
jgi:hypothetical protein